MSPWRPSFEVFPAEGWTVVRFGGTYDDHRENARQRIEGLIEEGCRRLALDFEALGLIGSGFLGLLVSMTRRMTGVGGRLILVGVGPQLQEILSITNIQGLFDLRVALPGPPPQLAPWEERFVGSIRECAGDGPCRVCADWLEDEEGAAGRVRAEFIRAQCELERDDLSEVVRAELTARADRLQQSHGARWAAPLAGLVGGWEFRRGFVDQVRVHAATLVEEGDLLLRLAPIRRVLLGGWPVPPQLAGWAGLAGLTEIDARQAALDTAGGEALVASPYLDRVRLLLSGRNLGDSTRRALQERFGGRVVFAPAAAG